MAGPEDFLPPSFWAASISCLFLSSSSICFFFACLCLLLVLLLLLDLLLLCSLLGGLLLLLLGADLFPGGLLVLQPLQLGLLLGALIPPLRDVFPQLVVHL